jgi:hypothetical protein
MKKWGSHIVTFIGYAVIGFVMSYYYHLDTWDVLTLIVTIDIIKGLINFINKVIEY